MSAARRKKDLPLTFEESLSRLENIVEVMGNQETDLETAMALYREGLALSKVCGEQLACCETEVELLRKEADGMFSLMPFGEE